MIETPQDYNLGLNEFSLSFHAHVNTFCDYEKQPCMSTRQFLVKHQGNNIFNI